MAQLTWRNVDTPNFSGVNDLLRTAAYSANKGFDAAREAVTGFQKDQQDAESARVMAAVMGVSDPSQLSSVLSQFDLSRVNPEALKFAAGRPLDLANLTGKNLDNDQQRINNDFYTKYRPLQIQSQSIQNQTSAENLNQTQWNNTRARSEYAARPAFASALTKVDALVQDGKIGEAQAILRSPEFIQSATAAGHKPDDIAGYTNGLGELVTKGYSLKDTVETRQIETEARNILQNVAPRYNKPEDLLRDLEGADPRTIAEVQKGIKANPNLFLKVDPAEFERAQAVRQARIDAGLSPNAGPLRALLDKVEAPSYGTLYGNAEQRGGAFEGTDVTKATIGQLKQWSSKDGDYGKAQISRLGYLATPMGRFQIVGSTLAKTAEEMGLPDNTVFTPQVQEAMFQHLVQKRLAGPQTMAGKMTSLRQEWAGLKNVSDADLSRAITAWENGDQGALSGVVQTGPAGAVGGLPAARALAAALNQGGASSMSNGLLASLSTPQSRTPSINTATPTELLDSGTSAINAVNQALNAAIADSAADPLEGIAANIATRPDKALTTVGDVVEKIAKDVSADKGGTWDESVSKPVINGEVERLVAQGIPADIAGYFVKQAVSQNANWFRPDTRYLAAKTIDGMVKEFYGEDGTLKGLNSRIQAAGAKKTAVEKLTQLSKEVEQIKQEFATAYDKAESRNDKAGMRDARIAFLAQKKLLDNKIAQTAQQRILTPNTLRAQERANADREAQAKANAAAAIEAAARRARGQAAAAVPPGEQIVGPTPVPGVILPDMPFVSPQRVR